MTLACTLILLISMTPCALAQRGVTETEIRKSDRRRQRAASYAKRFAAKEACAKALGTGMSNGVFWRDMGVVNLPSGKPTIAQRLVRQLNSPCLRRSLRNR